MERQVGEEVEGKVLAAPAEELDVESDEQLMSTLTLERVAAAKKYIEDHYRAHMKLIQQRKERSLLKKKKFYSVHFHLYPFLIIRSMNIYIRKLQKYPGQYLLLTTFLK